MANTALFVGWGVPVRSRERAALQVFNEWIQYCSGLQQQGKVENFETVLLESHGGDLGGFFLIRGSQEQISGLRADGEFQHNITRAGLVVEHLGVVTAFIGDQLNRLMGDYQAQVGELT